MKTMWTPEYSVGIEEIDKHHRIFFDYFNLVEDVVNLNQNWSSLFYVLEQLEEYSKIHFSVEESLMDMYAYPGKEGHIIQHKHFVATVQDLKQQSVQSTLTSSMAIFMRQWFENHIKHEDFKYAEFILNGAQITTTKKLFQ